MSAGDTSTKSGGRGSGLIPIVPGQVLNPKGRNQWSYREDFEHAIGKLLKGKLSDEEAKIIPEWMREIAGEGMTRGEALATITIGGALRGDEHWAKEALKRVWPATEKREYEIAKTIVVLRDYSGGRNGSSPHEIGSVTIESEGGSGEDVSVE